jgi:hypothetical protein
MSRSYTPLPLVTYMVVVGQRFYCFNVTSPVSELGDIPIKTSDQPKSETDSSATPSTSLKLEVPEPTRPVKSE